MFCLQVYTCYYIFNYCYYNIACKILPRLYLPVITAGSRNTVGAIVLKKKKPRWTSQIKRQMDAKTDEIAC